LPAERVLDIERVTGIPRHELRPDLYPPPVSDTPLPTA
jgi:DNA-binding transcriptional regulator YdaS (Cro superfamily)